MSGLMLVEADVFCDDRGFFLETYKKSEFEKNGINKPFIQVDHSRSKKNVLRGLHYQLDPMAQEKMVDVIDGEIFDVVVDMRKNSATYGKWMGLNLGGQKRQMLYIPGGFAHGFCVLSKSADIIYYCTQVYSPEKQRGVLWNDPVLNVAWPVKRPIVSVKDKGLPLFKGRGQE